MLIWHKLLLEFVNLPRSVRQCDNLVTGDKSTVLARCEDMPTKFSMYHPMSNALWHIQLYCQ